MSIMPYYMRQLTKKKIPHGDKNGGFLYGKNR